MFLAKYVRWDVIALIVALIIVFGLELLGVFTTQYVTITALVRNYIPKWSRAMALGWLCYHFLIQ